eukprot:1987529-Amphidinium_carterae.1
MNPDAKPHTSMPSLTQVDGGGSQRTSTYEKGMVSTHQAYWKGKLSACARLILTLLPAQVRSPSFAGSDAAMSTLSPANAGVKRSPVSHAQR